MKRRETLKSLLVGGVAGAAVTTIGCKEAQDKVEEVLVDLPDYGRTPAEKEWDRKVLTQEDFFTEHEMSTIATLCDIILPPNGDVGGAIAAEVPDFIAFIVKDIDSNQLPIRGGIMWLDGESNKRYNKRFDACSDSDQISIVEDIAYPDPDNKKPLMAPGIKFFNKMRDLTLTGYYTTRIGFNDLGYKGNIPNIWDGVPEEILAEYDVDYDPEWIAKCVDNSKREDIAEWDDDMNLIT